MKLGPVNYKERIKDDVWYESYEKNNVKTGIECGFIGKAQIGKGMWAKPDEYKEMMSMKYNQLKSGASCAWVPSPTAATLHAIHYHDYAVRDYQERLKEDNDEGEEVEEEVNENDVSSDIGSADNKVKPEAGDSSKIGQGPEGEGSDKPAGKELEDQEIVDDLKEDIEISEDIDLEEVLKALTEEEDEEEKKDESVEESVNEELNTIKADLEEHRNVVKYLRGKLNEVNLLNAKLLFTNKLFRNFGLNNEQKLKVVETFDRATNLREVKLVFSTLAESFGNKVASKPSKPIKESKGSSSKPVASTKPKTEEVISEGFDLKERFQKLAKIL